MKLGVVTATLDRDRLSPQLQSWRALARGPLHVYIVVQTEGTSAWDSDVEAEVGLHHYCTPDILGVVPAFALGVQKALEDGCDIIACFHDDLLIEQDGWDQQVVEAFTYEPQMGLCGFGGGVGLADEDIYQTPYNPMQLARKDFISNMRDAESHGRRVGLPQQVACLDGFSQIGRREFWNATVASTMLFPDRGREGDETGPYPNLFTAMERWGIIHHAYDAALGCFAKRLGWEVWMLPVKCHHFGGQTAVGDPRYHEWANQHQHTTLDFGTRTVQDVRGDQLFWEEAHRIVYQQFRDVLPIRV